MPPPPHTHIPADQNLDAQRPSDYDCRCFFLHRPRLQLYHRIDARVEEMVAGGLLKVLVCAVGMVGEGRWGQGSSKWRASSLSVPLRQTTLIASTLASFASSCRRPRCC